MIIHTVVFFFIVDNTFCGGSVAKGRLEVASVPDGAARGRATDAGSTAAACAGAAEDIIKVV